MAGNGGSAIADHIRRRGIFNTMQLSGLQDNAILQVALAGSNSKAPYYPQVPSMFYLCSFWTDGGLLQALRSAMI